MAKPGFVLFGATGDLARRMLWPSLFHLHAEGLLPDGLIMLGSSRSEMSDAGFAAFLRDALAQFGHPEHRAEGAIDAFLLDVRYVAVDAFDPAGYGGLGKLLETLQIEPLLVYLSVAPTLYQPVCNNLAAIGAVKPTTRLMLEKPIGHDLASCRSICDAVGSIFAESQVFRIDHYLGKETVQNLLALRFANSLFEPIWGAHAIDHVQITVAETVGVEGRWSYYDDAGALRDMVQNHILQTLALVAMEPPSNFEAAAVRNEKVKVLQSLRPIDAANVRQHTVTGQYVGGVAGNARVPGYLEESGAVAGSRTETFVALAAHVDNWRWKGVPFFLRTGKRMEQRCTEIMVQFKEVPHNIFSASQQGLAANRLHIRLQPEETITLQLMSKEPGLSGVRLKPVGLNLSLTEAFDAERRRIAYERLLLDAFKGVSTLFVRRDELEAAWLWIDGIHRAWDEIALQPKPYPAGTPGPVASDRMLETFGAKWHD